MVKAILNSQLCGMDVVIVSSSITIFWFGGACNILKSTSRLSNLCKTVTFIRESGMEYYGQVGMFFVQSLYGTVLVLR